MKVTKENKKQARQFLFPDMPEPVEPAEASPLEQLAEFRLLSEHHGGLFRPTDAAALLGIAYVTVKSYVALGSLESVEIFGSKWVSGNAIEARILKPRRSGRPPGKSKIHAAHRGGNHR